MRIVKEEEAKRKKMEEEKEIARKQQEQIAAMQAQIKAMTEVKKPQMFYGTSSTVESFVKESKEYIEKKMRGEMVEEQIIWVLTFMTEGATDRWKEMILDDLDNEVRKYVTIEEFLGEVRK